MNPRIRLLLIALLGLVAVVGAPALWVKNYMDHDPRFCTTCHLMGDAFGRWSKSEHSKITCHSCHIAKVEDNLKQLYFAVVEPKTKVEKHAEVDRTLCLQCHESRGGERWQAVMATAGHAKHMEREAAQCVDCHSTSLHSFTAPADVCSKCHEKVQVHENKMAELECLDCHDFLAEHNDKERVLLPRVSDCRRCHGVGAETVAPDREKRIEKTIAKKRVKTSTLTATSTEAAEHPTARIVKSSTISRERQLIDASMKISETGMHGGLDCKRCHNPHAKTPEEMRSGRDCTRCHRGDILAMKTSGPEKHRDCSSCHRAHSESGSATQRCTTCHEGYKTGSKPTTHNGKCSTCHQPHKFKLSGKVCSTCHAEKATKLADEAPKQHDQCTNCHSPHAPPPHSEACMKCHKNKVASVTNARPPKHRECTSCHDAHSGVPKDDQRCRTCHEEKAQQLATAVAPKPQHMSCRSCHRTMHGTPEVDSSSCTKCHADKGALAQKAGTPEPHKKCSSCHDQHAGAKPDPARCMKCHEQLSVGSNGDKHTGECVKCHKVHGPPGPDRNACQSCHKTVNPIPGKGADKHRQCRSCHQPHRPAPRDGQACRKCHEKQSESLVAWAKQVEHQKCSGCHVGHDPGHPKSCGTCHQEKAAAAKGGKHTACQMCHRPHLTKTVERRAWWNECGRCHTKQVEGAKQRGATHSKCENCHQPHAFKKPTCDSCHNAIRTQLMHAVSAHQKCVDCHDTHGPTGQVRAACVRCHENRATNHYPEATRCDACHVYSNQSLGRIPPEAQKLLEKH